jgi:endonuclease-3
MLSAQTTDVAVNKVTNLLFSKKQTLEDLANSSLEEIESYCKQLGLYKNKSKNIIGIAKQLLEDFDGVVPSDKNLLQTLPGVGNKTAGVIRAEIFHIPDFPVDTHILRISKRLKLVNKNYGPDEVEKRLKKLFPKERWIKTHHQLIHFGRYHCLAKNPRCNNCKLKDICSKN